MLTENSAEFRFKKKKKRFRAQPNLTILDLRQCLVERSIIKTFDSKQEDKGF